MLAARLLGVRAVRPSTRTCLFWCESSLGHTPRLDLFQVMPIRYIPFTVTTIALLITIPAVHFLRSRPRTTVARLSFCDQLAFLLRSNFLHLPLPKNIHKWRITDTSDPETSLEELYLFKKTWKFLEPFFASHGYTLYQFRKGDLFLTDPAPSTRHLEHTTAPTYPYSRRIRPYPDQEVDFSFNVSMRNSLIFFFINNSIVCVRVCCNRRMWPWCGYQVTSNCNWSSFLCITHLRYKGHLGWYTIQWIEDYAVP